MSDLSVRRLARTRLARLSRVYSESQESLSRQARHAHPPAGDPATLTKITLRGNALAKKTKIGLTRERDPSEKTELGAIDRAGAVDVETREL